MAVLGVVGVGVAITMQSALASPPPPAASAEQQAPPREPVGPPARCIDGWAECPKVPGADWVALAELEAAMSPESLDAESVARCLGPTPLLSASRVPGMHLLCVLPPPAGEEARVAATIAAWPGMVRRDAPATVLLLPTLSKAEDVVAALSFKLGFPRKLTRMYQPPALFTESGVRLVRAAAALGRGKAALHRFLCLEGGQWLWPPVEVPSSAIECRLIPLHRFRSMPGERPAWL